MTRENTRRVLGPVLCVLALAAAVTLLGREMMWRSRMSRLAELDRLVRPVVLARDAATENEAIRALDQWLRSQDIGWGDGAL